MAYALATAAEGDPRLRRARLFARPPGEGAANAIFRVAAEGGAFYAKLARHDGLEREREGLVGAGPMGPGLVLHTSARALLARAAAADVRLLRRLDVAAGGLVVTGALSGRAPRRLTDDVFESIARAAAALHQRDTPRRAVLPYLAGGATAPAMARVCDELLHALGRRGALDERALRALTKRARDGRRMVERDWCDDGGSSRWRLCHGDLRPANVIVADDGAARLIDFELCGLGDPMVDLARFVAHTRLGAQQELTFLNAYAEATQQRDLDRYFCYRPLAPLFVALSGALHVHRAAEAWRATHNENDESEARNERWLRARTRVAERDLSARVGEPVRLLPPRWPARGRVAEARTRARSGVIAIDGAAGSGKTPIAAALARALGVAHYNTGAAYRAAALLALEGRLDATDPADVRELVEKLACVPMALTRDGRIKVEGRTLSASLDVMPVETSVARWARLPAVRDALMRRALAPAMKARAAVIEGRDVKSVLRPDALLAFWIDVEPATRAALVAARGGAPLVRAMTRRDRMDRTRSVAPSVPAAGAIIVKRRSEDSGELERVVARMVARKRGTR